MTDGKTLPLDVVAIQNILPHRYPFLLVDRVIEMEEGKKVVGIKNVTRNEEFFNGHFPGHPIMPGVLILEAMAQVAGVLMLGMPENRGRLAYFAGINNAKFRRPVVPGDQLRLELEVSKIRGRLGIFRGIAMVDGQLATEADLTFAVVDQAQ